jgi:uncharacterized protein YndB with AHSA1/START domain
MAHEIQPLTVRHTFESSPARVFDAWLDPVIASQWLFATEGGQNVRCGIEPHVGGAFVITDRRNGEDVEHRGTYLEVDRPRRIVFTFSVPRYSSVQTTVRLDLADAEAGCELTLVHEGVLPEWASQTEQGWRDLLARLDVVLGQTRPNDAGTS